MFHEELIILEATKKSIVINYCLVFHHPKLCSVRFSCTGTLWSSDHIFFHKNNMVSFAKTHKTC